MLRFRCPHCQGKYKVPDRKRGTIIHCPHCDRRLNVPYEGSSYEIPYSDQSPNQTSDDSDQWPFTEDQIDDFPVITPEMNDTVIEQTGEYENILQPVEKNENAQQLPPLPDAKTSGMAIASLILGLLFFPAILGLILGIIARKKIRQSQRKLKGAGLALAGIIISSLSLIASIVSVVVIIMAVSTVIETVDQAVEQAVQQAAEQAQQNDAESDENDADDLLLDNDQVQDNQADMNQTTGN